MTDEKLQKYSKLVAIWNDAETECLAAEAILNQVSYGDIQAATHILRSWKLLGKLCAADKQEGTESLPDMNSLEALKGAISDSVLVEIPKKTKSDWEKHIESLYGLNMDPLTYDQSAIEALFKDMPVSDLCDELNDSIRDSLKNLKFKYSQTFLQKLHITKRQAIAAVLLIIFILYLIVVAITGFWSLRYWLKPRFDNFVIISAQQEWGKMRIDRSVDGNTLTIAQKRYTRGIGTHATSRITIGFNNKFALLKGSCGLDDEAHGGGSIACAVYTGDGRLLWQGPVLRSNSPIYHFEVPVNGIDELELRATDAGDGINSDHADWVDLELK